MNIKFTVEDYFKELQLMESQYGQEEELYPWVYMLLQMIEIRKKEILKEELAEEVPVEAAPEEAPAVETETPVVEEVTDTVREEKVDEVKE